MLYLTIYSWEPEKSEKVWELRKTVEGKGGVEEMPKGLVVLEELINVGADKAIVLWDVEDPNMFYSLNRKWADLCKIEIYPVIRAEDALKYNPPI